MKRFNFRLQRIFDYREALKLEQQRELARKTHELAIAEDRLTEIDEERSKAPISPGGLTTMAELGMLHDYMKGLTQLFEEQTLVVKEAESAVEAAREIYMERAIDAKTLATVKERRFEEFNEEKGRKEKTSLDGISVQRHRFREVD